MILRLLLIFLFFAAPALADPLTLDAAPRELRLDEMFTKTTLTVFGTSDEKGEVVVVFEGPPKDFSLTRKESKGPLWLQGKNLILHNVPVFYAVASTQPLTQMMDEDTRRKLHLSLEDAVPALAEPENREFTLAFMRLKQKMNHYAFSEGQVEKQPNNGFRAELFIPSSVPVGDYTLRAHLFRDGRNVATVEKPYKVRKIGLSRALSNLIERHHILFAFLAVGAMLMMGLAGSLLLPRR